MVKRLSEKGHERNLYGQKKKKKTFERYVKWYIE
jgi:hypothetical protein